jgi:DNA-binding response OmpR family regulator
MKIFKNLTILSVDNSSGDDNLLFLKDYCREFYRASNYIQAIKIYKEQSPQIIIMDPCFDDVMINFAKEIRRKDERVVFVAFSECNDNEALKEILELNFASYMPKQISKKDLLDGLIKVAKRIDPKFIYLPFHCVWDRDISKLYFFSDEVFLTRKESRFLDLLIRKKGAPCSEDEIIFYVWGDDYDKIVNNTSVRTLIKNLRKKIPKELIKSSYGLGYSIEI